MCFQLNINNYKLEMEQERNERAPGPILEELYKWHNQLVADLQRDYARLGELMEIQNGHDRWNELENGRVLRRRQEPYPETHWNEYREVNGQIRRGKDKLAQCAGQIKRIVAEKRPGRNTRQYIY
jgi:hypothetical protein